MKPYFCRPNGYKWDVVESSTGMIVSVENSWIVAYTIAFNMNNGIKDDVEDNIILLMRENEGRVSA